MCLFTNKLIPVSTPDTTLPQLGSMTPNQALFIGLDTDKHCTHLQCVVIRSLNAILFTVVSM